MKPKTKVLLAMSGGVDSSVAALLLKQQGYEVIGAFMKNWSDTKDDLGQCTWVGDRRVATQIASKLNIPLITLDFEKEYRKEVVSKMYELYRKGITPNPDIDCNNKVKFPLLWKTAKRLGADFIATGHYVRKQSKDMLRAKDESKDQSYFLYRLNEDDVSHSLFPIGDYTKKKVRKIAEKNKFPNFNRKSTTGICFIGKVNLKKFLQKKIKPKSGKILDPKGNVIGRHDGIYYYTIGQRIGPRFGIEVDRGSGAQKRWYVARKDARTNTIIAAPEGHPLNFRKEILMRQVHWVNPTTVKKLLGGGRVGKPIKVLTRIRQVGELLPSTLRYSNGKYKVMLNKSITGVSQGQAVVLYQGTRCIGGGVIGF